MLIAGSYIRFRRRDGSPLFALAASAALFATILTPGEAGAQSLPIWLTGQRIAACFPWFVSGIGNTVEAFDTRNVNAAINTDAIEDGDVLLNATIDRSGPDTLRVAYDPQHRIAVFDHRSGESQEEYVLSGVTPPPRAVDDADLSAVRTEKGVRLGRSFAQIVATALRKPPRLVRACGYEAFVVVSSGPDCTNERDFIFKDRRLAAYGVGGNC